MIFFKTIKIYVVLAVITFALYGLISAAHAASLGDLHIDKGIDCMSCHTALQTTL